MRDQAVSDDFILINTHCVNTRTCVVEVLYLIVIAALNMFTGIKFALVILGFTYPAVSCILFGLGPVRSG